MGRPHSIRFFMKRARVCQLTFGDSAHRRNRGCIAGRNTGRSASHA